MERIEIVKPKVEYLEQTDLLKQIEVGGRTCYKSEAKITSTSAEKFVKMLCGNGHTSATEHGTVYFTITDNEVEGYWWDIRYSKFSHCNFDENSNVYITTNFRVVLEACYNDYEKAIEFIYANAVKPTANHEKRYTFRITCDRGVTHELVRHRRMSFSQESSRYVRYNKAGYQFVEPAWWNENPQSDLRHAIFTNACQNAADAYGELIKMGQTPQQARAVLPNALKAEIVVTATSSQWDDFLKLRTAKDAHPDMQIIANMIGEKLKEIRK